MGEGMTREVTPRDLSRVVELLRELWPDSALDVTGIEEVPEHYLSEPGYWCYGYDGGEDLKASSASLFVDRCSMQGRYP